MSLDHLTPETTDDGVLGGRLRLLQPRRGHRFGHDAILLAAAADAPVGGHVVDLGAGVGTAGLALAWRRPDLSVTLVERDPGLAGLAAENVRRNGFAARARAAVLDVEAGPRTFADARLPDGAADAVIMNPPFNDAGRLQTSPVTERRMAHAAVPDLLSVWMARAAGLLGTEGRLTLIWRADELSDVLTTLGPAFGGVRVLPVHPRPDAAAIRVLVGAAKGSRAPLALLPGLHLNDGTGKPGAAAEAVLRAGEALRLWEE